MNQQDYSEWTIPQLQARLQELIQEVQATDQQGLPVNDLLAELDRVMAMNDLLMEQFKGTEFYHGYWRSRQILNEPPVLPPGERAGAERLDVAQRAGRLAELARRRRHLKEHAQSSAGDERLLVRQLDELGLAAGEPDARVQRAMGSA